jgi:hypothetical protein
LRKQSSAPFLTLPSLIGAKVSRVASGYCTVRTSGRVRGAHVTPSNAKTKTVIMS